MCMSHAKVVTSNSPDEMGDKINDGRIFQLCPGRGQEVEGQARIGTSGMVVPHPTLAEGKGGSGPGRGHRGFIQPTPGCVSTCWLSQKTEPDLGHVKHTRSPGPAARQEEERGAGAVGGAARPPLPLERVPRAHPLTTDRQRQRI